MQIVGLAGLLGPLSGLLGPSPRTIACSLPGQKTPYKPPTSVCKSSGLEATACSLQGRDIFADSPHLSAIQKSLCPTISPWSLQDRTLYKPPMSICSSKVIWTSSGHLSFSNTIAHANAIHPCRQDRECHTLYLFLSAACCISADVQLQ